MEYTALQSAGQMLEHVRRFALELNEASGEMRPRDAERLVQQAAWLERRLAAAAQLPGDAPGQTMTDALADAAVEAWRLERVLDKAIARMSLLRAQPLLNAARWCFAQMDALLSSAGIEIVDLAGQAYSPGLPVKALNAGECGGESLRIAQTVEPVIMADGGVWRMGSVMLEEENP